MTQVGSLLAQMEAMARALSEQSGRDELMYQFVLEMFESTPDPVWIKILDGDELRMFAMNRAYRDRFAIEPEKWVGNSWFWPNNSYDVFTDNDREAISQNRAMEFLERWVNPITGEKEAARILKWPGRIGGHVVVFGRILETVSD